MGWTSTFGQWAASPLTSHLIPPNLWLVSLAYGMTWENEGLASRPTSEGRALSMRTLNVSLTDRRRIPLLVRCGRLNIWSVNMAHKVRLLGACCST
jgi:hypothetical protein